MSNKKLAILFGSLASLPIYANSIVLDINNKADRQNSYAVSLSALKEKTPYQINCEISGVEGNDTPIAFEPHLLPANSYGAVMLNSQELDSNSGVLQKGNNVLSFGLLTGKEDSEHYNRFELSSNDDLPIQVKQCFAQELSNPQEEPKTEAEPKTKEMMLNSSSGGGFFIAYNDTNALVTLAVGDFFPDSFQYKIYPKSYSTIYVSTDNQNIHVKEVLMR